MRKFFLPLCLMALTLQSPLKGQITSGKALPEALYQEGKEMFEIKNWDGCLDRMIRFKELTGKSGLTQQADKAVWTLKYNKNNTLHEPDWWQEADFMMAISSFEKGKAEAENLLLAYQKTYPNSRHKEEISFYLASCYFLNKEFKEAINLYQSINIDRLRIDLQPTLFQRMGVSYIQTDNDKEARPLFEVLSETDNAYTNSANYYLAFLDYKKGQYARAKKAFLALPSSQEYDETVPYYLTQIYFIEGDRDKAEKSAKALLQGNADEEQNAELNRILAMISYEQGDFSSANQYFKPYFSYFQTPVRSAAYAGGVTAYNVGDYSTAIKRLSLATNVSDALQQQAFFKMGQTYLKQGDMNNARMAFERASTLNYDASIKEQSTLNYGLVIHQSSYAPFNEAVTIFENFLNDYPNSQYTDQVNDCLVESYMTTRNYDRALTSINKISNPGTKILAAKQRILFQLGTQNVANADLVTAESFFTDAIKLGSLNKETLAQAYFWRGECEYRNERYSQAQQDFMRFVNLSNKKDEEIYALGRYNLAYAYFKQHQFPNAINWFDKYISLNQERGKSTYVDAMNRLGDAYFYQSKFGQAQNYYAQAARTPGGSADYALFQQGFMAGLQKKESEKIRSLKELISTYPSSEYADDALFEISKSYLALKNNEQAIATLIQLENDFPNSPFARQAGVQLGLIYFNNNRTEESIQAYKHVINKYPGSEEALIAVEDLKTVYVETNDIPAYASYVATLKGKVKFDVEEQDSLTYMAAEKVLIRNNKSESIHALKNYLQSFEQGAFRLNAYVELARIYNQEKNYPEALKDYEMVIQQPDNKFTEEALVHIADIYFMEGENQKALDNYRNLLIRAQQKQNKEAARLGILHTTVALDAHDEVVLAANDLLENQSLSPELHNEALYCRAKALMSLNKISYANKDLEVLAKDTRSIFGAEAAYLLAENYFNEKAYDKAEKQIMAFIDSATPHQYWLARGFILLADIYIVKGDSFQAKQYLQSLESNYNAPDDIQQMIKDRYKKIKE